MRRTRWRKPKGIGARPGRPVADPKGWAAIRRRIAERDGGRCRRCGQTVPSGKSAVDHTLPRRLLSVASRDDQDNLTYLDGQCHALKRRIEDRLFSRGETLGLYQWIRQIAGSGPVPGSAMIAEAFRRAQELLGTRA